MRIVLALVTSLILIAVALAPLPSLGRVVAQARQAPAGTSHTGKAFRFNKVKEGIYHAIGTGSLAVVGNSAVIVNDNDVGTEIDQIFEEAGSYYLLGYQTSNGKPDGPAGKHE